MDDQPPDHPDLAAPDRSRGPGRWLIVRRLAAAGLAVAVLGTGWSYAGYLRAPGDAPVTLRTADWLRDHGFESTVDQAEQWWYTHHPPTGSRPPTADLPVLVRTATARAEPVIPTSQRHPLPGEGTWVTVPGLATPAGAVTETFVRPDRSAPSVSGQVVRFDQHATRLVLVPGTRERGGGPWAWKSQIPASEQSSVLAAFNAGFKFRHTRGGFYSEGRHAVRPLANGLASIVIHRDGTADVAKWGRDATLTPDVVSVRQNLDLIVDQGRPAPGLTSDRGLRWGTAHSQFQYTWRSAVGVDGSGRLIYMASSDMTLKQLAAAMTMAGAVRAMQLDMHDGVVTFNWFRHANDPSHVTGTKLMPSMERSATRFLASDWRDFLAVATR